MTKLITLDFETYYDKDYSLKKLTTEQYIRHRDFQVIGVAVKVDDGPTEWFSGTIMETKKFLDSFDIPNNYLLAHNMVFDGAILAWKYVIKPKYYLDTLSMAKPVTGLTVGGSLAALVKHFNLGEKGTEVVNALGKRLEHFTPEDLAAYGEYCKNDVEITYKLYQELRQFSTPKEQYIIDLMIRMYTDPVLRLDINQLEGHLTAVQEKKAVLMKKIDDAIGRDDLMSNMKFAEVLKKLGVTPPIKISIRTGKPTYAFGKTDQEFKALLEHDDPRVQTVVAARLGVKSTLEETRTEAFINIGKRGRLPIMLNYYGAHTGRASGGDGVNLQNLPRGGTLRKSIMAPDKHTIVAVDSSQIEARVVAWLAGQDDLVQDFRNKEDIYSKFATDVYGRKITKEDKVERFVGKTCIAEGTLVLSDSGWKPIEQVSLLDKLWDGEEWVCHQGLLNNGIKPTLNLCGIWLTPDHQVLSGTQWLESQLVAQDENILSQALDTGAANLPFQAMYEGKNSVSKPLSSNATVTELSTQSTTIISKISKVLDVLCVPRKQLLQNAIGCTAKQCQMINTGLAYSIASLQQSLGVIRLQTEHINITGNGESKYAACGAVIEPSSYATHKPLKGGITLILRWIESMLMGIMSREISASYREAITSKTNVESQISKPVYDILNCGSRNRFTILTKAGPLIVHNCILGLGYGLGKDKFRNTLKVSTPSVELDEMEAERIVKLYRSKYSKIVDLWSAAGDALSKITNGYDYDFGVGVRLHTTPYGIKLPNDMLIRYPNLRKSDDSYLYDSRKGPVKIFSSKVVENVVQALARIVVFDQMAKIDQEFRRKDTPEKRFKVALTVHDEIVAVVPEDEQQWALDFMVQVMSTPPKWAADLPVACEGDFAKTYGDCK